MPKERHRRWEAVGTYSDYGAILASRESVGSAARQDSLRLVAHRGPIGSCGQCWMSDPGEELAGRVGVGPARGGQLSVGGSEERVDARVEVCVAFRLAFRGAGLELGTASVATDALAEHFDGDESNCAAAWACSREPDRSSHE